MRFIDLTNQRFGRLLVKSINRKDAKLGAYYDCKCDCGKEVTVRGVHLKSGKISSCNCLRIERVQKSFRKGYGEISGTFWVTTYHGAKRRNIKFLISIKDAWHQYQKQEGKCALSGVKLTFQKDRLTKGTASIDRIDSNKPYTKNNIQWVHKTVNLMKNKQNEADFIKFCKLIAENCDGRICT